MNEDHLKRKLSEYFKYYHKDRTHLGLDKDITSLMILDFAHI